MSNKLTIRRANYANNLFLGMKQRPAYIKAGYSDKGQSSTIDRNACELAKNSTVVARLAELRAKAEDDSIIKVIELQQWLTRIIRLKPNEVLEFYDNGQRFRIKEEAQSNSCIGPMKAKRVVTGTGDDKVEAEIISVDIPKMEAAKEMGKQLGAYAPDKQINLNLKAEDLTDDELATIIKRGARRIRSSTRGGEEENSPE